MEIEEVVLFARKLIYAAHEHYENTGKVVEGDTLEAELCTARALADMLQEMIEKRPPDSAVDA